MGPSYQAGQQPDGHAVVHRRFIFAAAKWRTFGGPMEDTFDERVQLALKVLASVYAKATGTITDHEIRMLRSYLGAEDWTGAPLDQVACAVIQRELNRTQTKSRTARRQRCKK
jgi:hypothetical protein